MRLLLSSDAPPEAPSETVAEVARRRHLDGPELSLDWGQGYGADAPNADPVVRAVPGTDCPDGAVVWDGGDLAERLAGALGAPSV